MNPGDPTGRRGLLRAIGLLASGSFAGCTGRRTRTGEPQVPDGESFRNAAGNRIGTTIDAVENLAEIEGSLTLYTTLSSASIDRFVQTFNETYPWLTIAPIYGGDSDLYPRWMAEYRSGTIQGDLLLSGSVLGPIVNQGTTMSLSHEYLPNYEELPTGYKSDHFVGLQQTIGAVHYNADLIDSDAVDSWADLVTDPQWSEKIGFDPSPQREMLWGLLESQGGVGSSEARTFVENLKTQRPIWINSSSELANGCASGDFPICFTDTDESITNPESPLGVFPGLMKFSAVDGGVISNKANNPNGSLLFLNWLLSDDGQRSISGSGNPIEFGRETPEGDQHGYSDDLLPVLPMVDSAAALDLWDSVMEFNDF